MTPHHILCPPMPTKRLYGEGGLKIETLVSPEYVFKYATERCIDHDMQDHPARAFRSANGRTRLCVASCMGNYQSVGANLNSVSRVCTPTYTSAEDIVFNGAKYHEWVHAPFTLDGTTVYSLIHNEWYNEPICHNNALAVMSLTQVKSTDAGATWSHPADYIIRRPPAASPWPCDPVNYLVYGCSNPSNIIDGRDGYYYAFFTQWNLPDGARGGVPFTEGTCLMRTSNLDEAGSWQVWQGTGWGPAREYTEYAAAKSAILPNGTCTSITFNTYLNQFFALQTFGPWLCYSLADRMLGPWSYPNVIMRYMNDDARHTSFMPDGVLSYPSLLDPTDSDRNYNTPGRDPYVYWCWAHSDIDAYIRDTIRQKIHLTKLPVIA